MKMLFQIKMEQHFFLTHKWGVDDLLASAIFLYNYRSFEEL